MLILPLMDESLSEKYPIMSPLLLFMLVEVITTLDGPISCNFEMHDQAESSSVIIISRVRISIDFVCRFSNLIFVLLQIDWE